MTCQKKAVPKVASEHAPGIAAIDAPLRRARDLRQTSASGATLAPA